VLHGLSLRVEPGELTLLVGPNGAGKSTTMKILAGLARADGGGAFICGHDLATTRALAQRSLSYLPQNPQFHPRLSSLNVLKFYARVRGVETPRCRAVLEQVGLVEAAKERTGALSGGMRQRLGLALLLLAAAPVLLLDEPGLSLDPGWRARLQDILREEAARGCAVLVTTHLIAEWNGIADRCLLCRDGRIAREIDPTDLPHDFDDAADFAPECV
jgi:ABC-type multidrug transport system ATPase subunit